MGRGDVVIFQKVSDKTFRYKFSRHASTEYFCRLFGQEFGKVFSTQRVVEYIIRCKSSST